MILDPRFQKSTQSVVPLGEGRIISTEIWLRVLHGGPLVTTAQLEEIWHLTAAIDYYELDVADFNVWSAAWYEKRSPESFRPSMYLDAQNLLFPTWRFDHAKGFAAHTKYVAYNGVGHVMENNPTTLYNYHLPSRIIRKSPIYSPDPPKGLDIQINGFLVTASRMNLELVLQYPGNKTLLTVSRAVKCSQRPSTDTTPSRIVRTLRQTLRRNLQLPQGNSIRLPEASRRHRGLTLGDCIHAHLHGCHP